MKFDSALEAQQNVFKNVFRYVEIASGTDLDEPKGIPFFTSPSYTHAAQRGETIRGPLSNLARGIGRGIKSRPHANREFELIVYCQDRKLVHSPVVESIQREAHGEARAIYVGPVRQSAGWEQSSNRPLRLGSSIGHRRVTSGTLGCFVKLNQNFGVLSNNHVLANVNEANAGDPILQPGKGDGGVDPPHRVATLHRFVPISFGADSRNFVDAAVAVLLPNMRMDHSIYDGTATVGTCGTSTIPELEIGESVIKVGRTTGFTRGQIQAINVNQLSVALSSQGSQKVARFDGQIAIEGAERGAFSKPGDSGALVMNSEFRPAALCFAGAKAGGSNDAGLTFANPIDLVLNLLDCTLTNEGVTS
jgi:hypothetical protein